MSDLSLTSVSFHPAQQVQQNQPPAPQPPKGSANAPSSQHGPAVVLSGAFAQGAQGSSQTSQNGSGQSGSGQQQTPGQHINHVI